jgi:hypothetical protein
MTPTEACVAAWVPYLKGQVEQRFIDANPNAALVSLMPEFRSFAVADEKQVHFYVGWPGGQPRKVVTEWPCATDILISQLVSALLKDYA